jgi:hypothetical protein
MSPENLEKLHTAFDAVHEAARVLDDSESPCGCCGLKVKKNWEEAKAKADLMGAAARIARVLDVLEEQAAKAPTKEAGT